MREGIVPEYDVEPVHGLPAELPPGERILWQGSPEFRGLLGDVFHAPMVALYFGLLLAYNVVTTVLDGGGVSGALYSAGWTLVPAVLAVGTLAVLAQAYAKGTVYTLTNHRLVIRSGIALTMAVNVPLGLIENASLRSHRDGTGDLTIQTHRDDPVSWLMLWPNVRPMRFRQPEPMLRAIPEASLVASLLTKALREEVEQASGQQVASTVQSSGRMQLEPVPG